MAAGVGGLGRFNSEIGGWIELWFGFSFMELTCI